MYIKFDIETIARTIKTSWSVAGKTENHDNWLRYWDGVTSELDGMWDLVNYAETMDDREEMLEEIRFLIDIAIENKYAWGK